MPAYIFLRFSQSAYNYVCHPQVHGPIASVLLKHNTDDMNVCFI